MHKILLPLFANLLISCTLNHALIYQITCWKKDGHIVNIFHDCHVDTDDYQDTCKQHADLVERNSFKIVEDMGGYQGNNATLVASFDKNMPSETCSVIKTTQDGSIYPINYKPTDYRRGYMSSPMFFLTQLSGTYNAECRFLSSHYLYGASDWQAVKEETLVIIEEISDYNDNAVLNEIYTRIVDDAHDIISSNSAPYAIDLTDLSLRYTHLDARIVTWSMELLDARALHALYQNAHEQVIDIIVGGLHAKAIEAIMPELGYIYQKTIGKESWMSAGETHIIIPVVDIARSLENPTSTTIARSDEEKKRVIERFKNYYYRSFFTRCLFKWNQLAVSLDKGTDYVLCVYIGLILGAILDKVLLEKNNSNPLAYHARMYKYAAQ